MVSNKKRYADEERRKAENLAKNSQYELIGLQDIATEPLPSKKVKTEEEEKALKEEAKKKDIEERNEIDRKIREKDIKKKKVLQGNSAGMTLTAEEKAELVPELQKKARQIYLEDREGKQLERLRRELDAEEHFIRNHQLTETEYKLYEHKKEIFKAVQAFELKDKTSDIFEMPVLFEDPNGRRDRTKAVDVLH